MLVEPRAIRARGADLVLDLLVGGAAFQRLLERLLGGAQRLTAWAKEDPANERVFWGTIFPKLLPLQVTGANGGALVVKLRGDDDDIQPDA